MLAAVQWQVPALDCPPEWFVAAVRQYLPDASGQYAAQLLWQRGIRQLELLQGFLDAGQYQPTSPFAFGEEMARAVARVQQARQAAEQVAIWGDFDADGVTATAVLWEGLSEFLPPESLTYWIPNRLTESHGLSMTGIKTLAAQGYSLIVTCDTGSADLTEIQFAQQLGVDLIITDHHTLPANRPPVAAILNPRCFSADHALANLSGVAVAYKLVEGLYQSLPELPQRPLSDLLDLVAIGLIADLVNLTGECRYLAQIGIARLQQNQDPVNPPRPGIAKLLELCRRSGDRPTDISFGLGPRINAISRIHGDAHFCIELLTSHDSERCQQLALQAELANARRRVLQKEVMQQAQEKLAELDLSTTSVIVLADPQWPVGILGLVAGQIAQTYGRPTILLSTEGSEVSVSEASSPDLSLDPENSSVELGATQLARGSARSVNQIDLYGLLQQQAHLLHRFGGHPFAAGLSLPITNIALFTQAINQQLRSQLEPAAPTVQADLVVTVADLGKALFQELKLLEPCGMGNPVPKLLIQNCWFRKTWHRKIQDFSGRKLEYIKTEFELCDDSCAFGFPGVWWGHYKDELPVDRCDVIVELDFNSYQDAKRKPRYEVRLLAIKADATPLVTTTEPIDWIIDERGQQVANVPDALLITTCPSSWNELHQWFQRAKQSQRKLVLAYDAPVLQPSEAIWQQLMDLAQALSRTKTAVTWQQLQDQLKISRRLLQIGLQTLDLIGFKVTSAGQKLKFDVASAQQAGNLELAAEQFLQAANEEQFIRQYFFQAPLSILQTAANQLAE